ncbi:hypothetical protein PLICRDRAFT_97198 [Plicaturopsis crispa FD-325 SS-3]|nr:hypothetical protein PLICRDRAFT_97198 [Plicaturopsis crispa FD-325 SS-3]
MAHSRSASGPGATLAQIVHHDQYYLRGGDVTFLVENTLFRVHRYFFERESPYFHAKLCTPVSPGQNPIGTSDQNAFSLDGVKSTDFARFLWVFYNPKYSLYSTTVEEWKSILRLAHEWSFAEVKNLVVRELEKMVIADIPKIVIYHSYDVERTYLLPNYAALCAREDPITLHEGRELGLETVLRVAEARERLRRNGPRSPTGAEFPAVDLQAIVCEIFEISPPSPSSSTADASFRLVNGNSAAPAVTPAPASTSYVTPSSFSSFSANPQAPRAANGAATVGNSLFNSVFNTGASNGTAPPSAQLTSPRQQPTSPKQQPTSPFTRPTSPPAAPLSVSIAPAATGDEPSGAAPPSALPTGTTVTNPHNKLLGVVTH